MTFGEKIKELTLKYVEEKQGCKATELAVLVTVGMFANKDPAVKASEHSNMMLRIWDEMVKKGELIQVEYLLPQMPERIKTLFYLPHGTVIIGIANLNENIQPQSVDSWIDGGKSDR